MSKIDKMDFWREWSDEHIGFPSEMQDTIDQINLENGLDINHEYGYKIMFYMYMEGWEREQTEQYFKLHEGINGIEVIYVRDMR